MHEQRIKRSVLAEISRGTEGHISTYEQGIIVGHHKTGCAILALERVCDLELGPAVLFEAKVEEVAFEGRVSLG
jgi:hypothetical protein